MHEQICTSTRTPCDPSSHGSSHRFTGEDVGILSRYDTRHMKEGSSENLQMLVGRLQVTISNKSQKSLSMPGV